MRFAICPGYAGKIRAGEEISEEDILSIISSAVKVTNEDFIDCLSKPGLDGKPFIGRSILCDLAARIGKIRHKRVIPEEDDGYNRVNSLLTDFFERQWGGR